MRKLIKVTAPEAVENEAVEEFAGVPVEQEEEVIDLDEIEEVLADKPKEAKKAPAKKAPAKKAAPKKKESAAKRETVKVAQPNRLTLEGLKEKESINLSDLSTAIFSHLVEQPAVTKKTVEEMVSLIFSDIIPSHMDQRHPVYLGAIRVSYSDVATRAYPSIAGLNAGNDLDTLVEAHTVARFRREIDKVTHRGRISEDKKKFVLADENGELTKRAIKL